MEAKVEVPAGEVDTIFTIPNLFTLLRLLCLPLFVWLLFGLPSRQAAAWLLGGLGATDWVDGYLARRLGQTSEFGKKFDPIVDRVLFVVAIVAIMINEAMPIWFGVAVLTREVLFGITVVIATLVFGMKRFDVTWLGKTATFLLMFAVPGFLMGHSSVPGAEWFTVAAWCFGIPGLILSYYTAFAYIPTIRESVRAGRAAAPFVTHPDETVRLRLMNVPEQLRYSAEHEWAQPLDGGSRVRIGITDFAQDALGDVVYVDLPVVGTKVAAAESVGELESTKSVSEMYAPIGGVVVAINEALAENPALLNDDPYGEGWLIEIEAGDAAELEALLDADGYRTLTEG